MAKPSFPPLHCNDCRARGDDVQGKSIPQAKPDSVVNLQAISLGDRLFCNERTHVGLPLVVLNPTRFRVPEWVAAPVQMNLS